MTGLLEDLRATDKKGYFTRSQTSVSYPTLFHPLDYHNGFMLRSLDNDNNLIEEKPSIGIVGGTFNTGIGKAGSAKTTAFIQMGMNIVLPYTDSFVVHYDAEQATNYSRIRGVTGVTNEVLSRKYILKKDTVFIEDIFESILQIAKMKIAGGKKYKYLSGFKDEFGEPIVTYEPTVVIIDSIPSLELREVDNLSDEDIKRIKKGNGDKVKNEMQGDTHVTRKAKKLAQFYRALGPIIHEANIIVFAINHINEKIEMSSFAKTQAQTMFLKMHESLPGGNAPIYYANNIFKFVTGDKLTMEKDGVNGFVSKCEMIKSRTNIAGQIIPFIYDQECGFDTALSLLEYADSRLGVVKGTNPKRYLEKYPDLLFDTRKFRKFYLKDPDLQYALFDSTIPLLENSLSRGRDSDVIVDETEILRRVLVSMEKEGLVTTVA